MRPLFCVNKQSVLSYNKKSVIFSFFNSNFSVEFNIVSSWNIFSKGIISLLELLSIMIKSLYESLFISKINL